jgi:hypothetical protein
VAIVVPVVLVAAIVLVVASLPFALAMVGSAVGVPSTLGPGRPDTGRQGRRGEGGQADRDR